MNALSSLKGLAGLLAVVVFIVAAWQYNTPAYNRLVAAGLALFAAAVML